MKKLIYRFSIVIVFLFFLYHLTIGPKIASIANNINDLLYSVKELENFDLILRKELTEASNKDMIINLEDRVILKKVINKIACELEFESCKKLNIQKK